MLAWCGITNLNNRTEFCSEEVGGDAAYKGCLLNLQLALNSCSYWLLVVLE